MELAVNCLTFRSLAQSGRAAVRLPIRKPPLLNRLTQTAYLEADHRDLGQRCGHSAPHMMGQGSLESVGMCSCGPSERSIPLGRLGNSKKEAPQSIVDAVGFGYSSIPQCDSRSHRKTRARVSFLLVGMSCTSRNVNI